MTDHEARLRKLIDPDGPIFNLNPGSTEAIRWAVAEIDRLRDRLAAEQARMDWLEANHVDVEHPAESCDGDEWEWGLTVWLAGKGTLFYGDTLVSAIDAAMQGSPAP